MLSPLDQKEPVARVRGLVALATLDHGSQRRWRAIPATFEILRAALVALIAETLKTGLMLLVLALLLAATAGRLLLGPYLPENLHYAFYGGAALMAGLLGGLRLALLTVLTSLLINMAFLRDWQDVSREGAPLTLLLLCSAALAMVSIRAILQRTQAEDHARRLAAAALQLDLLLDSAADCAICMLNPAGRIVHWNEGAALVLGWRDSEAIGRDLSLFLPSRDRRAAQDWLAHARAVRRHEIIVECQRRDGSRFTAQLTFTCIGERDEDHRGFGVVIRNMTIARQIEEAVRMRETQLRFILAAVPDATILLDDQGCIQLFSPAAERMFGFDERAVMNRHASMLLCEQWQSEVPDFLGGTNGAVPETHATSQRVFAQRADLSSFPAQLTIGTTSAGNRRLYTVFVRDLTEQEKTRAMVESLQMEVLHGARLTAMGTMASTLAHELNQPMTAMANYVEGCRRLLARPGAQHDPRVDAGLAAAAKEAVRAGRFISHLREFVSRGETMLAVEQANEVVASGLALVTGAAKEAGVTLEFRPAEAVEIFADRVQIQQVIINLVRNAIEAIRHGDVRLITVSLAVQPEHVEVSVDDCGAGFKRELAEQLFDAFVSTKQAGLGVGLSICRTIVEAHGGKIWASSSPGSGASFRFTLCRKAGYAHGD
jgi:two-component system sensor kinase FixL